MLRELKKLNRFQLGYIVFFTILPLIYCNSIIDPVLVPRQLFLSSFILVLFIMLITSKKLVNDDIKIHNLSGLLILSEIIFVLISFVSIAYSDNISEAMYVSSKYGILLTFLVVTYYLVKVHLINESDLVRGVIIVCIISLLIGIVDLVFIFNHEIKFLSSSFLITSAYANKNLFGSLLILCLWAVLISKNKFLKLIIVSLIAIFILFIQSKIVIVVFAFILILYLISNWRFEFKYCKWKRTGIAAFASLFVLLVVNWNSFENLSNFHTFETRIAIWENSIRMLIDTPFGVGAGNWQFIFPKYGLNQFDLMDVKNGATMFRQPHNDFIWVFCELGTQGILFYLANFCIMTFMLIRMKKDDSNLFSFIIILNIIGYCMIAFFDFPLERIEHQSLLVVMICVTLNRYDLKHEKLAKTKISKFLIVFCFILVSLSLLICYYRLKGEYYTKQFIALDREKSADLIILSCNKAKSIFYTVEPSTMPIDFYAGISLYSLGKIEEAKRRLETALYYSQYNINIIANLIILNQKLGNNYEARKYQSLLTRISPNGNIPTIR